MDNFLENKYHLKQNLEIQILQKIIINEKAFVGFLTEINSFKALYACEIENSYSTSKQYFFNAAQVSFYTIQNYDAPFYTNIYAICFAILSDNEKIIYEFSKIKQENYTQIIGRLFVQNFQNALNDAYNEGDIEELTELIKKKPQGFQGLDKFFIGLQNRNLQEVEKALEIMITNHGKRGELELYKDYISFEVTALAKLAWRKGIEVEVNSPLVPKELLPIQPLEKYEISYDFLK